MSDPRITYTALPDTTPESERDALAAVYAFVLGCSASRKAADVTGGLDEVKEVTNVDPTRSLPEGCSLPTGHP